MGAVGIFKSAARVAFWIALAMIVTAVGSIFGVTA
jgi:hypothetical protein